MRKLVSLDEHAETLGNISWAPMEPFGELVFYDRTLPGEAAARIADAEIVFTTRVQLGEAEFSAAPGLRLVCCFATGYNMVDVAAAARHGVTVCNVPAYSTDTVAQHAFALLLELCDRVGDYSAGAKGERWVSCGASNYLDYPVTELAGKTLGVVGYGSIGRRVAAIGAAFGMRVLYTRSAPPAGPQAGPGEYCTLDALLAASDVVSLHCPLTDTTRRLIDARAITRMKDGALLINTSRGPVVDEAALAAALRSGKLGGAGLDVLCDEPPKADNPLLHAPNCFLTPHIAWASQEARERLMHECAENVRAFLAGAPRNVVRP